MTQPREAASDPALDGFLSGPPIARVTTVDVEDVDVATIGNSKPAKINAWLLGTGTPIVRPDRSGPAVLVTAGDATMLVDCGSGTPHQLSQLGVSLGSLTHIFLTHHHIDHNADLGFTLIEPWLESRGDHVAPLIVGPPGTAEFVRRTFALHDYEIRVRLPHGWDPELLNTNVLEVGDATTIRGDGWTATAFEVDHRPVQHAFGYRFDTPDQKLVISGDTTVCENLITHAQDADVLVHEVIYPGHGIPEYHTLSTDVGDVARRANAKHLVLTHLIPGDLPDSLWLEHVSQTYSGPITVGRDLAQIVTADPDDDS